MFYLRASPGQFRTGWFIESVVSAALIIVVIRTRTSFFKSLPSYILRLTVFAIILFALFIPQLFFFAPVFEFEALPTSFYGVLAIILVFYVGIVEWAKKIFYRRVARRELPALQM